ncbi:hypothetical protein R5R35_004914 [Gryllus longicercus]|uniref:Uncharacterized protein n=1 Tax=Gryllus longicercus TaxID=2509291 RepID=A0AAN9Z062_9ORTH
MFDVPIFWRVPFEAFGDSVLCHASPLHATRRHAPPCQVAADRAKSLRPVAARAFLKSARKAPGTSHVGLEWAWERSTAPAAFDVTAARTAPRAECVYVRIIFRPSFDYF